MALKSASGLVRSAISTSAAKRLAGPHDWWTGTWPDHANSLATCCMRSWPVASPDPRKCWPEPLSLASIHHWGPPGMGDLHHRWPRFCPFKLRITLWTVCNAWHWLAPSPIIVLTKPWPGHAVSVTGQFNSHADQRDTWWPDERKHKVKYSYYTRPFMCPHSLTYGLAPNHGYQALMQFGAFLIRSICSIYGHRPMMNLSDNQVTAFGGSTAYRSLGFYLWPCCKMAYEGALFL